jgi:hypothetical protein
MGRREQHTNRNAQPQDRHRVATKTVEDSDHIVNVAFDHPTFLMCDRV